MLNAALALTIFVVFHRVRDFAEKIVEKLLFHSWQHNEATLRRFVKEASFIDTTEALAAAVVAELNRFSRGAECALFAVDGHCYRRTDGAIRGIDVVIDGDDPVAVTMRADTVPVAVGETRSGLPAVLALPMAHRAQLHGFILLGGKPSGDSYRPDEIEVLGWAAHQIGLDLHALKVAQLEAQTSRQRHDLALLKARNDELRNAIAHGSR